MENRKEIEEFYQEEIWTPGMKHSRDLTEEDCEEITHVTAFYIWRASKALREFLEPFRELMIKAVQALCNWIEAANKWR